MISICCLSLSESDAGGSRVIKLFSYIKFFIFVCGGGGERNKHKKNTKRDIWGIQTCFWFLVSKRSTDS